MSYGSGGEPALPAQAVAEESWATPNTMDHLATRTDEGVLKQATGARKGRSKPANLREQVDERSCAIYAAVNWPTPRANSERSSRQSMVGNKHWSMPSLEQTAEISSGHLPREFKHVDEIPGAQGDLARGIRILPGPTVNRHGNQRDTAKRLNPDWVGQLMTLPDGWLHPAAYRNRTDELRLAGGGVVPESCAIGVRLGLAELLASEDEALIQDPLELSRAAAPPEPVTPPEPEPEPDSAPSRAFVEYAIDNLGRHHLVSPLHGRERTLCGYHYEGDEGVEWRESYAKRVTCEACLLVIGNCQAALS